MPTDMRFRTTGSLSGILGGAGVGAAGETDAAA
jgi:hypothetical protein